MPDWPHQTRMVQQTIDAIERGVVKFVATAPTGAGKTRYMLRIAEWGEPTVVYSNRRMLIEQLSENFEAAGIKHGVHMSGYGRTVWQNVQIASVQSAHGWWKSSQAELPEAKYVIIDEAHNETGKRFQELMEAHLERGAEAIIGLTATPIGLSWYDELLVGAVTSELRKCGALVPAVVYAPDEPSMASFKPKTKGILQFKDEYKEVMLPVIFGRCIEHYYRLNPDGRPSIGFADSVASSQWFAERFTAAGVPSAHIDGERIWMDGESMESSRENRRRLAEASKNGRIKTVWNRFVLREGIDWPWLYHAMFACTYGSLKAYLQSGGRLLRNHESLDHVCVARGTKILTDRGEVPIQNVTTDDLIWDGVAFVSHDGPTCVGNKAVIQWCGLSATPDHKVLTDEGWETLKEAKEGNRRIVVSGVGGQAVRVPDYSDPYRPELWPATRSRGGLRLWKPDVPEVPQDYPSRPSWLRCVYASLRAALSGVDLSPRAKAVASLQRSQRNYLSTVWRAWDSIQVCVGLRRYLLDCGEPWNPERQVAYSGPNRQRWRLRAGESSLGKRQPTNEESRETHQAPQSLSAILSSLPSRWILPNIPGFIVPHGSEAIADCEAMGTISTASPEVTEVWDILNCGPRHRYTASGVLVGNCVQDHGGNWWRHDSLNCDREWHLDDTENKIAGERAEKFRTKAEPEPITCPQCSAVRRGGASCSKCGFTYKGKKRLVIETDGSLREVRGDIYKPRKVSEAPEAHKTWIGCYFRCKRSGKTFAQARGLFMREMNYQVPGDDFPLMPKRPADWHRKVCDVPREELTPYQKAKPQEQQESLFG